MYIIMTNSAVREHKMVRGRVTDRSSMSILAREALPVRVAAVFFSSTYFCTRYISRVMLSSTTAMAAAPCLS